MGPIKQTDADAMLDEKRPGSFLVRESGEAGEWKPLHLTLCSSSLSNESDFFKVVMPFQ